MHPQIDRFPETQDNRKTEPRDAAPARPDVVHPCNPDRDDRDPYAE
jgi:hypothetical protein